MTVFSLLYASRSTIPSHEAEAAVQLIVDVSQTRNETAGVTGCLIFGAGRFAQILEGEQAAVNDIMGSISRDPRHTEVTILEQGMAPSRRFAGWALGYRGPSLFVQRTIAAPVAEGLHGSWSGISDLLALLTAFGSEQTTGSR